MKILVTGGPGVIGAGLVSELLRRNHQVRLLAPHAESDARQWSVVEPFNGDVADAATLNGVATGIDAVVHIAGIAAEHPPETTFEKVNVGGTRNILAEAQRAGVRRFIYVSSLGADRGTSDYHRSKFAAEDDVARSPLEWVIVRAAGVYGPGDEEISTILKMVRTLPAIPVVAGGDQQFQPIWYRDLASALAEVLERSDLNCRILEVAGSETTSLNDLLKRLHAITDRKPLKVPVPMPLANAASRIASTASHLPIDDTRLTMLRENNVLHGINALTEILGVRPTPLADGLRELADSVPEILPEDGVGAMHHKRFWADIDGTHHTPTSLMNIFRERVTEIMPIEFAAEPRAPTRIEKGTTLTASLPLRGHIQIRVEANEPTRVIFGTVEGHPLAGTVEFSAASTGNGLRFVIDTWTRAANVVDLIAMNTIGRAAQSLNWFAVVQRMVEVSGGTSDGVHSESRKLSKEEAAQAQQRVRNLVHARKREEESSASERPA